MKIAARLGSARGRPLMLDNPEHLPGRAPMVIAGLVRAVLQKAPVVRVLTSWREALKLRAEQGYPLSVQADGVHPATWPAAQNVTSVT